MTGLGVRSSSNGSLEKTGLNGVVLSIQTTRAKPSKMHKEREGRRICKFAGRKKVGMLLLFLISAVVFLRVLFVGKGEDGQVPPSLHFNGTFVVNHSYMLPTNEEETISIRNISFLGLNAVLSPPMHFLGYTLPQGHPCNSFTLPPPPADRKRTGPRSCPVCYLPVEEAIALMPNAPSFSPLLKNLTYIYEEPLNRDTEFGGSDFGGYPTLKHRNDSFEIKETMSVHCGLEVVYYKGRAKNYPPSSKMDRVPKLLVHRMFPNARYSLWIDGKLELVVDPHQILESSTVYSITALFIRFLWRKNATFAISKHYKRFDVLVEAEANKAAGKYDNASIDFQVEFYKNEGLTPYSVAKLPITSDVPEGCVILREHVPISNLFTCLWFNEVDRFTSRDQISFSTVRDKIAAKTNWTVSMFLDCERRNFVVQRYHRAEQERYARQKPPVPKFSPPPPSLPTKPVLTSSDLPRKVSSGRAVSRTTPPRRRGRRSGPRGHRKANLPVRLQDSA
ncbi:hypothetical protein F2Q70_00012632 [Brassica cretica]|uniref:TOD1/MUCI70 glycosyltransferase-like domain-containing protein n=1 Tax=Brassica cretica TaxID=69181 RepID=A0A8S9M0M7_BRACR|nr:hypothetical protein F2Q70_00012632 [Brassica cretica]